jgi:hypothetical protein
MISGPERVLIVGNPAQIHVGAHLLLAGQQLNLQTEICDVSSAYRGPELLTKFYWQVLGHRPLRLHNFSQQVLEVCKRLKPKWLVATGISPIDASTLVALGELGVRRINFLTDDPWNPAHRANWFLKALPKYDQVFSPRRSNLDDLARLGCLQVSYLPFAYSPNLHFPEPIDGIEKKSPLVVDVLFVGGADRDRISYIAPIIKAGFTVGLYGGYWERFSETRSAAMGHADPTTVRQAVRRAKLCLCLVRRANRDGHVMRSYEIPAMGGCVLAEDTVEHREIFGDDNQTVAYFKSIPQLIDKIRGLVGNHKERHRLSQASYHLIVQGRNTYADRLRTMLHPSTLYDA